mmetsp:Transcript_31722/g.69300  ORF Transcript_31722/g.69300 Transcript_31722/m.69300 type:complete len:270 (+) Transcript_31722:67-876(+)
MASGRHRAQLRLSSSSVMKHEVHDADGNDLGPLAPDVPQTSLSSTRAFTRRLSLFQAAEQGEPEIGHRVADVEGAMPGNDWPDWPFDAAQTTTTLMLRRIPPRCTQQRLIHVINKLGFRGRYDFLYLPRHARSCNNRGFAFINLESEEAARAFFRLCHGRYLPTMLSKEPLNIVPAAIQGYERNILHHATKFSNEQGCPAFFFRPPVRPEGVVRSAPQQQSRPQLQQTTPDCAVRMLCASCNAERLALHGCCHICGEEATCHLDCITRL